jgi:hypothetical protein
VTGSSGDKALFDTPMVPDAVGDSTTESVVTKLLKAPMA